MDIVGGAIFVAASHQTGLDTRSMTRRSTKVGIRGGKGRTRALLDYKASRSSESGQPKPGTLRP